jgi:hypothetical protein
MRILGACKLDSGRRLKKVYQTRRLSYMKLPRFNGPLGPVQEKRIHTSDVSMVCENLISSGVDDDIICDDGVSGQTYSVPLLSKQSPLASLLKSIVRTLDNSE